MNVTLKPGNGTTVLTSLLMFTVLAGAFEGKLLTRGGRAWYKEGVTAPDVKRFALQPGYEEEAQPLVDALQR